MIRHDPQIVVCVLGVPRSGTTMLASMLASTPETIALPEMSYLHDLMELDSKNALDSKKFAEVLLASHRFKNSGICSDDREIPNLFVTDDLKGSISNILQQYNQNTGAKDFKNWVEHTPHNARAADLWLKYYPQVKFIHIVRDGRGVAASTMNRLWGLKDIVSLSENWNSRIHSIRKLHARIGNRMFEVRYEDLVEQPESTLRQICEFLGIDFQISMLNNNGIVDFKHIGGAKLIGRQVDASRSNGWKSELKDWEIRHFTAICANNLRCYNYDISGGKALDPVSRRIVKLVGKIRRYYSRKRFNKQIWDVS